MGRLLVLAAAVLALSMPFAWSQGGNPAGAAPAPAAEPGGTAQAEGTLGPAAGPGTIEPSEGAAAPAPKRPLAGDVIHMKSGALLGNIQIVRQTPIGYEVQVSGDVVLTIPRKLVESVEMDNIQPGTPGLGGTAAQSKKMSEIPGDELKPELHEKLTTPIPPEVLKFDDLDLVAVFKQLSDRLGVSIVLDQSVIDMKPERRRWTIQAPPNVTLISLLQDHFVKAFPAIEITYEYDSLLIARKPKPAPDAGPAPTPMATPTSAPAAGSSPATSQ